MNTRTLSGFPRRPLSEVEWEDLLVRIEIMPRALRVLLDDVPSDAPDVLALLRGLIAAESFAGEFLERAAGLSSGGSAAPQVAPILEDTLERFVRLRARNFAIVQRRGIDVWDWQADVAGTGSATVYQLLIALVRQDVDTLAAIRRFSRTDSGVC